MNRTAKQVSLKGRYAGKKDFFLSSLKDKSLKHKRCTKAPTRYPDGKSLAVGLIIEHFSDDIMRLISSFIRGGSVAIAACTELGLRVSSFDILVNFWQVLIYDPVRLYEKFIKLNPSKDSYEIIKNELKSHYKNEIILDKFTLARDYCFNFNLSYRPGFLDWLSSIYADRNRYIKTLDILKHISLSSLYVLISSFETLFKKYPNDFFYLAPPYYLENSMMFKGIYPQRNFPIYHKGFDHQLLAELLKKHKGRFILNYNDCRWIRKTYKDFKILEPKWQYTMEQDEIKMDKNSIERGDINNIKNYHKLLIIKD